MAFAVLLGLIQAWGGRNMMNPDGIQYIEVGLNYVNGHWASAVNGYWGPLYAWLLGLLISVVHPSLAREFPLVHVANFGIYLFALFSFRMLLRELIHYQKESSDSVGAKPLPTWVWEVFGYSLFLSSSLDLITLNIVTPDLAVSAFVYLVAALLLRIQHGQNSYAIFAALGFILGLGYLTKSIMFVFALIITLVALQLVRRQHVPIRRFILVPVLFVLIATPFIAAISLQKHRLTIGDNGRITYLTAVNELSSGYMHGLPPNLTLVSKHQPIRIHERPAAYDFGSIVSGSSPAWYDASYWYDGTHAFFAPKKAFRALLRNVYRSQIIFLHQSSLVAGVLVLFLYAGRMPKVINDIKEELWYLLVPALLILGLYFVILIQDRYVGPFLLLMWSVLFFAPRAQVSPDSNRVRQAVLLGIACALLATISMQVARNSVKGAPDRRDPDNRFWALKDEQVAAELNRAGIGMGDKVAYIGDSIWVYWAHLGKIRIEAEIPDEEVDTFYEVDQAAQDSLMRAFADTGAKIVVADRLPPSSATITWRQLGSSGYYVHDLR
jgi:hypothetical protein